MNMTDDGIDGVRLLLDFANSAQSYTRSTVGSKAERWLGQDSDFQTGDMTPADKLILTTTMWKLGDKYDIMTFRDYAWQEFALTTLLSNSASDPERVLDVAGAVWNTRDAGPCSLRQTITTYIKVKAHYLNNNGKLRQIYSEALRSCPEFAADLAVAFLKDGGVERRD